MTGDLPPLVAVPEIQRRLLAIFPEGTPNRGYCTREIAAKTVFVMLYAGAIEGDGWLRPDQVTRMTDEQARTTGGAERTAWTAASLRKGGNLPGRWYAVNTREPIRDETLRDGLVTTNAVVVRADLPTTSASPRYALARAFADLFHPSLKGDELAASIANWQRRHLSRSALARTQLVARGTTASAGGVLVKFPNGETRRLAEGPSSGIAKAVIEEFSTRFLRDPGVIFLSESRNKVVARDNELARSIGLSIPADRYLPDILLVDLGHDGPLLVFVEVVATDGPISENRRQAFLNITREAEFDDRNVAFVTAYHDRAATAFKKTVPELAWGSFAWFASEPDHLLVLRDGGEGRCTSLRELLP